jgi:hypothetical protein
MKHAAWIIFGGVLYAVAAAVVGRWFTDSWGEMYEHEVMLVPPVHPSGAPEWV